MYTQAGEKVWIPEISDQKLEELAGRIRPVYEFKDGVLRYIQPVDLRKTAYTWDPKPAELAENLKVLSEFRTFHSYGSPMFFKPSIAEVLAQIPEEFLNKIRAFQIVDAPVHVDDLNLEREALNAGYHVAMTRLYTQE